MRRITDKQLKRDCIDCSRSFKSQWNKMKLMAMKLIHQTFNEGHELNRFHK